MIYCSGTKACSHHLMYKTIKTLYCLLIMAFTNISLRSHNYFFSLLFSTGTDWSNSAVFDMIVFDFLIKTNVLSCSTVYICWERRIFAFIVYSVYTFEGQVSTSLAILLVYVDPSGNNVLPHVNAV